MRVEQSFFVRRAPEAVFDYLTDPARLTEWQTSKTHVEVLTPGPPRLGTRIRERSRQRRGRGFEQIAEFTGFERPHRVQVHVVEGPYPLDGTWSLASEGDGTRVHCVVESDLPGTLRLLRPLTRLVLAREFAGYHDRLRRNVEAMT